MSGLRVVSAGTSAGPAACLTVLSPDAGFPPDLAALPLVELQVLHSRITCQLEREYLQHPGGPHPVTRDRHEELVAELTARGAHSAR